MLIVNEGSTAILTVDFFDKDGNTAAPDTAQYRIDDVATGSSIRANTSIVASSSSVDVTLTAADNAMVTNSSDTEIHRVTVTASVAGQPVQNEYDYSVKNLEFV